MWCSVGKSLEVLLEEESSLGVGARGFGPGNPRSPCDGGDVYQFVPNWEMGPSIIVGSYCVVQPPCRGFLAHVYSKHL